MRRRVARAASLPWARRSKRSSTRIPSYAAQSPSFARARAPVPMPPKSTSSRPFAERRTYFVRGRRPNVEVDSDQRNAVALRVGDDANLVDGADVACRQVQRHEAARLGYPDAARLDVDVLPALRLDVRMRDVLRPDFSLPRDVALRHDFARFGFSPGRTSPVRGPGK